MNNAEQDRCRKAKAARRRNRVLGNGRPEWVRLQQDEAVQIEGHERWQWIATTFRKDAA
jgi:hypothetical protein